MKNKKVLIGLLLVVVFTLVKNSHVIACAIVSESEFQKVGENIYIDLNFTEKERTDIAEIVREAESRVEVTFGRSIASPKVILVSDVDLAAKYGANPTGATHRPPFVQYVVIGPEGINVDVVAHELTHAEIGARLSYWQRLTALPVWFDEGMALMVDYRRPYLPINISLLKEEIDNVKRNFYGFQFFGSENTFKNYQASRMAVVHIDPKDLYSGLDRVQNGEDIEYVFQARN